MPEGEFVREMMNHLERWTFIKRVENEHQVVVYPSVGKLSGSYPDDYTAAQTTKV